jgi:hypothetical protein
MVARRRQEREYEDTKLAYTACSLARKSQTRTHSNLGAQAFVS